MSDTSTSTQTSLLSTACESGVAKAGESIVDRALNGLVNFIGDKYGKAQILTKSVFQKYMKNAYKRFNQVKTLVTGTEPRPVIGHGNIYVNVGTSYNGKEVDTSTVEHLLQISNNILILGTGGVGKSMLMRYLFLNTVNNGSYVPVLLEMRKISNQQPSKISVFELVYLCMKDYDVKLPEEQFEYSLQHGKYLFLFDGFDEVKEELADETAQIIQQFSAKYPNNAYIITSRHGRNFSPLETFTVVESLMLKKHQAVSLASKLWQADEKTKEFCRQLEQELFKKHKDFAENPLLLTMMFITFMYNNSIPDHLSDFYEKAYQALYSTHDNRNKGVYKRDFRCKTLDEQAFKKVFSHFCFQTYFKETYEFSEIEILSLLSTSIEKVGIAGVISEDYLLDLRKAVCLIIKDGDIYRFSHRSFQAYFAAFYTARTLTDKQQEQLFHYYLKTEVYWGKRDYYKLVFQMEPKRFLVNAFEKELRRIKDKLSSSVKPDALLMKMQLSGIDLHNYNISRRFSYLIGEHLPYNTQDLFEELVLQPKHSVNSEEHYLNIVEGYLKKVAQSDNISGQIMYLKEIDVSKNITDAERDEIYDYIVKRLKINELRIVILEWLDQLDSQRNTLTQKRGTPDFLDVL